jgi:DNA-binding transcriptional regulator YiaG
MGLADFRRTHDLSQDDLARLLTSAGAATSLRSIQNWEQGVRAVPPWVEALLGRLKIREIRDFPRAERKTRPVGKSTKHAK